ncbi:MULTISPECIES: RNA polymerase sigma factor [unclassified Siphonobacter]|uniref:RNA polymerase sigma factor n=1 Tax=unclassified Siphonobacter TaxID=2635712 RepID=UPI0027D8CDCB|nr:MULTISPECIES: sigma-70 family RNA polymerase sigma factor [unclassified Siphonobacter]
MKNRTFLSDDTLLELLRQGDTQAFETIYTRYWTRLYNQAYKRLKSKESTEELIQELFVDLWERRSVLMITHSLEAYLRTATKYLIIQYFQKEEVRGRYLLYYQHWQESTTCCTEEVVALKDLENALEQHLSNLSPQSKLVYQLSRHQHLTITEIAHRLNISEKTAENHLGRALKSLRVCLKDYVALVLLLLCK